MFAAFAPSLAHSHGIAGNRFFVGTLTFDDPSVADEAIVPDFSTLNRPVDGGNAVDDRFDWSFTHADAGSTSRNRQRLDTPQLADHAVFGIRAYRRRHQKRNLSQQSARDARSGRCALGDRAFRSTDGWR